MTSHFASADTPDRPVNSDSSSPTTTKTPLFAANHSDRYQRQTLITQIQDRHKRLLICYVSGGRCIVDEHDTKPFVDLLHKVPPDRDLDLMLHTTGGSIDAAEKLMGMLRKHVGPATLRIVVPDFAKSSGTLMVLGADSVVMSDMSELGPIDPQALLFDRWQSVQNYLDAYNAHATALRADRDDIVAQIMLGKLDPATLKSCESAVDSRAPSRRKPTQAWNVSQEWELVIDRERTARYDAVAIARPDDFLGRRSRSSDRTSCRIPSVSLGGMARVLAATLSPESRGIRPAEAL